MALPFAGLTGLPEQAVGGFPLGLGSVVEDRPIELSCTCTYDSLAQRRNLLLFAGCLAVFQ